MVQFSAGSPYVVPIQIIDPDEVTPEDVELLALFDEVPPHSKFRPGDLAMIKQVTEQLRLTRDSLPPMWQIRFVVSRYAFELMRRCRGGVRAIGLDHAVAQIEATAVQALEHRGVRLPTAEDIKKWSSRAVIYAHGFPHGNNPDSAAWFPESCLRRLALRGENVDWRNVLDEAHAPFLGYDEGGSSAPFIFDVAPDLYSSGENLGVPFSFEEATVHTAALLGLENAFMRRVTPDEVHSGLVVIDPYHDTYDD